MKTTSLSTYVRFFTLKPILNGFFCATMLFVILMCSGCVGAALRLDEVGSLGTYATLKPSMKPIPPGRGRLFVYLPRGGPSAINTLGAKDGCTVDDVGYKLIGKTFWYINMPAGIHKITATGVYGFMKAQPSKYGSRSLSLTVPERGVVYCRINLGGDITNATGFKTYTPVLVDEDQAEAEMQKLDFYKNFRTGKKIE